MEKIDLQKNSNNLGIEVLRFLLCLWIVFIHCSIIKGKYKKFLLRSFHVPTFILISFYFYYKIASKRDINKIISRFQRLIIPYILWSIIFFIINNLLFATFSFGIFIYPQMDELTLKDIYLQLLIGARYHLIFWFQFNLIFLSLIVSIISFIAKNHFLKALIFLGVFSFYLNVSKINFNFFIDYKAIISKNLGSLIELMPISILGCIWGSLDLFFKLNSCSTFFNFLKIFIIYIIFRYDIFIEQPGFRYPNVSMNLLASIILFISFISLPFQDIKNKKLLFMIKIITNFTGGIYYIHPRVRDFLRNVSFYFYKRTSFGSFIIYILCYFICFIGNKIFKNYKIKYLFK